MPVSSSRPMSAPIPNPFSSRFIRPGAIDYALTTEQTWAELIGSLETGGRFFIDGPHGSGKSTFLHALLRRWVDCDQTVEGARSATLMRVGPNRRVVEQSRWGDGDRSDPAHLICVDGWDHWSWWWRRRWNWSRQRLLVTTHRPLIARAPTSAWGQWRRLYTPQTTRPEFHNIVAELQGNADNRLRLPVAIVDRAFDEHRGNLREALFALYDEFESRHASRNESHP